MREYMRRVVVLAIVLSGGVAHSSPQWPNEPAGFSAITDCPFSDSICNLWNAYSTQSFASPGGSPTPLSPPRAFETYMQAGSTTGNGQWGKDLPNVRELYIGAWWYPFVETMGNSNGTNKLLFARNPSEDNSFLVWQGCAGCAKTLKWYFQVTYDVCPGCPGIHGSCRISCGDGTGWADPNGSSSGVVLAGSGWHQVEIYLKASTSSTSRNGIVRWWLDGSLVGNYTGINITPSGFTDFQINHTWDGFNTADRDLSKTWKYWWDHLRISAGSGGGGPISPPPPPGPTPPPPPPLLPPLPPSNLRFGWLFPLGGAWPVSLY